MKGAVGKAMRAVESEKGNIKQGGMADKCITTWFTVLSGVPYSACNTKNMKSSRHAGSAKTMDSYGHTAMHGWAFIADTHPSRR
eukprot:1142405-Pelagomonas_calceolata.AAC.2